MWRWWVLSYIFFCCSFTLMIPRIYNDLIECAKPWLYFNWLRFNDTLTFFPNESNGKARFFGRRGKQMSLHWCNDIGREIWIQLTNNNSAVKNVPIHRNKWECRIDKLNFQRQPTAKKTEIERNRQEMKRCKYLAWRKLDDASYQFFLSQCVNVTELFALSIYLMCWCEKSWFFVVVMMLMLMLD